MGGIGVYIIRGGLGSERGGYLNSLYVRVRGDIKNYIKIYLIKT